MTSRRAARALFAAWLACAPCVLLAEPVLLPDTGGAITDVAIAINSARRAALRNAVLVGNIINGLSGVERVLVATNDRSAFAVASNPWPERIAFVELPPENPITIWTQDPFLVLHDPDLGETTLLVSKDFQRADDRLMAEYLARGRGFRTRVSELHFEGGNIVSDEQVALIGANTIRHNALLLAISEADVVRRFQEEVGKGVLVVGPLPQPVGHIDMALTPLGDGRIAVADASAGIAIAEQALRDAPRSVAAFEQRSTAMFFGHPEIRAVVAADGEVIEAPDLVGRTRELLDANIRIAPLLDGIAAALGDFGYSVERIPFFFGGPAVRDDSEEGIAAYPMLTYNNVLLERTDSGDIVYLPSYGWEVMDRAAADAWRQMGFSIRAIDGLTTSSMYGGSLRCSVKVLRRQASNAD